MFLTFGLTWRTIDKKGEDTIMQALAELLEHRPSLEALEQMAQAGVPRTFVDELAEALGVQPYDLAPLLHISDRTLRRYSPSQLLPPGSSERALQIARVLERATEVIGSREKAAGWLTAINGALGAVPLELLGTTFGGERVLQILGRIEDTVYS
jgi:putative toxin-antitoxin system antitoxin component (TIGR02293 family)